MPSLLLPVAPERPDFNRVHSPHEETFSPAPIDIHTPSRTSSVRSIPELIQYNAENNGDSLFCYQALKTTPGLGDDLSTSDRSAQLTVTFRQLHDAVWRCTERLRSVLEISKHLPTVGDTPDATKSAPVALFMDSDIGLLVHLFSLMALGVPVALLSARLSTTAIEHLLVAIKARAVIASPRLVSAIQETGSQLSAQVIIAPSFLEDFVVEKGESEVAHVQHSIVAPNHFMGDEDRNVLILHSSGTTGLPKAIYQPHKYLLTYATCHTRTEIEDIYGLNTTTLPLYHGFGLVVPCLALGIGKPFWLPPPQTVPNGSSTAEALRRTRAKSLMTVPHILDEIAAMPFDEGIAVLLPLQFVACGGGPLRTDTAETLAAAGVKLIAHFGTTETGPLAPVFAPGGGECQNDWRYWRLRTDFDVSITPIEDSFGSGGKNPATNGTQTYYQLRMTPFGWKEPFVLQDRLIANPRSSGHEFRAVGRMDDLIVLVTGEKVQPRILETLLGEHPLVNAAVVFGNGQFELGVIVEPATAPADVKQFKTDIWPVIVEAGRQMDQHARLSSTASIVVTRPGQTLARSDKGAILRKSVYEMFETEIREAYDEMERSGGPDTSSSWVLDAESLETSLEGLIRAELVGGPVAVGTWGVDDDLFEQGLDSLQMLRVRRAIQRGLGEKNADLLPREKIARDFIYRNPSVRQMAKALQLKSQSNGLASSLQGEAATIESYIARYRLSEAPDSGRVILLTGSSGSLGSYLLAHLVSLPTVSRVICLRRQSGSDTHKSSVADEVDYVAEQIRIAESKGAEIPLAHHSKIQVATANPYKQRLGVDDVAYSRLQEEVTHIVHAAWPMDFQRSLSSFQSQFQFLHNLLQLARDISTTRRSRLHTTTTISSPKPRLLFVSSISVVGLHPEVCGSRIVCEESVPTLYGESGKSSGGSSDITISIGYAKAKLVCESIVADAVHRFGDELEATCVRVGQVSGSRTSGFWNPKEHFPAMVKISQAISKLPRLEGTLSWLPVDTAAATISDVLLSESSAASGPALIYHVENPIRQDWGPILATLGSELGLTPSRNGHESDLGFLSFADWGVAAGRLEKAEDQDPDFPAADMLLEFFRRDFEHMSSGGVVLDTSKARGISETLRTADRVDTELVKTYVRRWKQSGFLI